MSILSDGDADDVAVRIKDLELLVEQAADQGDYASCEYHEAERLKLQRELREWKNEKSNW